MQEYHHAHCKLSYWMGLDFSCNSFKQLWMLLVRQEYDILCVTELNTLYFSHSLSNNYHLTHVLTFLSHMRQLPFPLPPPFPVTLLP